MKSLPVLKTPVTVQYLNNADNVIYYFQQVVMSGLLQEDERLPEEEVMAGNLDVPVMDISRAVFRLHLYGVITKDERTHYLSALNIKLKEHIFLLLLREKPYIMHINSCPLINNAATNNAAHSNAHP